MTRLFYFVFLAAAFFVQASPAVEISFSSCGPAQRWALQRDADGACKCIHRAYYALTHFQKEIPQYFGKGPNFGVFFENPEFYFQHLGKRYAQCTDGRVSLKCVGPCRSENERLAYVRVFLGHVSSTINVCDELFRTPSQQQIETVSHEYGRLEGIGDAPGMETDNIDVWDRIISRLCDDKAFADLKKMHGE
jgi:hypothetical protein